MSFFYLFVSVSIMMKRILLIFILIILVISYIDLMDSCKKIDITINKVLNSKNQSVVKNVNYADLLMIFYD